MGVLRLFLALSVLLGHTRGHGFFGLSFLDRELAVQTFFIISGFYMALVLNEKYTQTGRYKTFIQQRFFRLYPTYLIIGVLILFIDAIVFLCTGNFWGSLKAWHDYGTLLSPGALVFMVVENFIILGQDWVMLLQLDQSTGSLYFSIADPVVKPVGAMVFLLNGPGWSLSVEFIFYLLAPFLVCRSLRVQLGVLFAGLVIREAMYYMIKFDAFHWIYSPFPPNLYFFMAGSLAYVLYKNYGEQLKKTAATHWWIFVIFVLFGLTYSRLPYAHQLYLVWLPLVFVAVPALFALTKKNHTDRLIGELSFPCYLIHAHVLMFTMPFFAPKNLQWMMGPVSVAMTVVLAYLFYQLIESRTERFREGLYKKSRLSTSGKEVAPASPMDPSISTPT